jgi:predicted amidophosphoribosyltransferase
MRICVVCGGWGKGPLCDPCGGGLHPAAPVRLAAGLRVFAAYVHQDSARRLVHRLKYTGVRPAAQVLAEAMVEAMPPDVAALVPVPRASLRRARYGVDPAVLLARLVGRETALPVISVLRAPVWWPANAGATRTRRRPPRFGAIRAAPSGSLLVDDVVTTGATLLAAAAITGIDRALTATRAGDGAGG